LSSAAQLGYAKIALALQLRVIFLKNHSRRVYAEVFASETGKAFAVVHYRVLFQCASVNRYNPKNGSCGSQNGASG
jgi:hypothetical protein